MNDQSTDSSILGSLFRLWHRFGVQFTALLAMVILGAALVWAVVYTPLFKEDTFGALAQKIMYLHIPFAIISFVAFLFGFLAAISFLIFEDRVFDDYSRACVEVGFLYLTAVMVSGPIWAKPVWGTWWSFEPRLNTFLIMWCLYAAYFVIPPFMDGREVKEKCRSIIAILGFMMVPVVYYSVDMIAPEFQNHPQRDMEMEPSMVWSIRLVMIALFLLFLCISWTRYRMFRLKRRLYRRMIGARS